MVDSKDVTHFGLGGRVILEPSPKENYPKRSRRFCITLNNYTDLEFTRIHKDFLTHAKKWIIGKEGDEKTPHLQCYVEYEHTRTFSAVKKATSDRIHIEPAKGNLKQNFKYCSKEGTYDTNIELKDVLSCKELAKHRCMKKYDDVLWRDWQQNVLDILGSEPGNRKIWWYWEGIGNIGKSFLTKYICMKFPGVILSSGKTSDIFNQVNIMMEPKKGEGQEPKIIILDIPRSSLDYINYTAMEKLKDGVIYSGKYEGGLCIFDDVHIICFANEPPNKRKMSRDRWEIVDLEEDDSGSESD